jgi:DNA polymerase (family 10)
MAPVAGPSNAKIAELLRQIAALLDEQNIAFKPAAYRKAAKTVEEHAGDICSTKEMKELRKLPGVGEAIAAKIREYCDTGRIKHLDDLMAEQGGLSPALMEIEGLGPKRVRVLQRERGISTVNQLIEAAKKGKLKGLPGFSDVMEKKILENAGRVDERMKRFPREEIEDDVEKILSAIKKVPGVEKCETAGSYRREKATVGDVDIVVVTKDPQKISQAVSELALVRDVVAHGDKKLSFNFTSGLRIDIRFVSRDQWGSALLYFTGDKDHNIALRKIAISKGWKLNEYGLFEKEAVVASKEEQDIYRALGLSWIEPRERTGILPDELPF